MSKTHALTFYPDHGSSMAKNGMAENCANLWTHYYGNAKQMWHFFSSNIKQEKLSVTLKQIYSHAWMSELPYLEYTCNLYGIVFPHLKTLYYSMRWMDLFWTWETNRFGGMEAHRMKAISHHCSYHAEFIITMIRAEDNSFRG